MIDTLTPYATAVGFLFFFVLTIVVLAAVWLSAITVLKQKFEFGRNVRGRVNGQLRLVKGEDRPPRLGTPRLSLYESHLQDGA